MIDLSSDKYSGSLDADLVQIADIRHAFAADMAREYGLSTETFVQSGRINAAATAQGEAHNRSFAAHLSALNELCEAVDGTLIRDLTGLECYKSGLFTPGCAIIQHADFVGGMAARLRSNRLVLHENSPVTLLDHKGDWVAKTPKGEISAPRVIFAVNGHLESFGHMRGRFMHVFTHASMTRALTRDEVRLLGGNAVLARDAC